MKTKEYFKKDIATIKRSFIYTLRKIYWILLISLISSVIFTNIYRQFSRDQMIFYFVVFLPVTFLGFFMVRVMQTKGYDIHTP